MKRTILTLCLALAICAPLVVHAQAGTTTSPTTTPAAPMATAAAPVSAYDAWANLGSALKFDGQMFAGIFASGEAGAYREHPTISVPEARLRFTYTPNQNVSVVTRLYAANAGVNSSGATSMLFDLYYVDINNWGGLLHGQTIRVGKFLNDFGEEARTDTPEEDILITNSAPIVSGFDGGLDFRGSVPVVENHPLLYWLSLMNDSGNLTASQGSLEPVIKLGCSPLNNLYLSASGMYTGTISGATAVKLGNLTSAPAGATTWARTVGEIDARYNYGPTGYKTDVGNEPTAPFQLAAAYGQFDDVVKSGTGADRDGKYWFVEGLYNVTNKLYAASRYSSIELNDGYDDLLVDSPVKVNGYNRLSLGLGYRISTLVHLKTEYTINSTRGGASEPQLNQFAVGVAAKF